MNKRTKNGQVYRHTPAFILLFLSKEDLYGAAMLNKLQNELPCYHTDSAVIYRTLQDLEAEEFVNSYWVTDTAGPARKCYQITAKGRERLIEYKEDIEMRMKNLEYFLKSFNELPK
jgi:PadR family transcriptional regulator PadR